MRKLFSCFRPEEALAVFFLFLLGVMNIALQPEYHRSVALILAAYGDAYFLPVGSLLMLSVIVWRRRRGPKRHPARDWLPYILCFLTYEMLHDFVHWVNPYDQDARLAALDFLIFGTYPALWLERFISPALTDYLSVTYILYFFFPPALGFVLYFTNRVGPFRDTMLSVVIACYLGYIGYLLVPAVGPKYYQAALFTKDLGGGGIGSHIIYTVDTLKPIPRDCFPSLHTALTTVVLIFAYRHTRLFFYCMLPFALSLFFSTVYLRYHYFVDLLAGWALAFLSAYLGIRLNLWWCKNVKHETA